ncbi:MAG: type II toxin-antitoxin system death-on-curing family toxin, partial [Gemmatimonadetes bacterium]|nr:type II toxin-antitoxin system death-on-curing family toxin [Gemmatimonadota bacterium]
WLSMTVILAIHSDQIREHGGSLGVRDKGLLESALDRPRNRFHYERESDSAQLAAAYGFGIAKNHPFIDGNKRVAFQAMYVFLGINGRTITADEEEVVRLVLALASGDLTEDELVEWLRTNTAHRRR